jgi:hypothetical protein
MSEVIGRGDDVRSAGVSVRGRGRGVGLGWIGKVDEVMRCCRSVITSRVFMIYLSADLTSLSAKCLFILGLGGFSKRQGKRSLD